MPYYGPDEPASDIALERYFLAGDFICGLGYGIQLMFYTVCAKDLWARRKIRQQYVWMLAYITLLICIETTFIAVQAGTVQMIYIDNRNYPGGPWAFFLATQNYAINVLFYATLFLLTFLADILVVWRCWVIWSASGRHAFLVSLIPGVLLLASFVMGTLWTLQSSQPGLSLYSALPLAFGTSYYAISLSVNMIATILISVRLFMYRRRILGSLPADHGSHYVSIATIIVESAALYSLFSILFLITYGVGHPSNQIFLTFASSAQQIATYMIIFRLSEGRAWQRDTLAKQGATLSDMNFRTPTTKGRHGTSGIETYRSDMDYMEKPGQAGMSDTYLGSLSKTSKRSNVMVSAHTPSTASTAAEP